MSIANYTFPFSAPPPAATSYLSSQSFGAANQAAAINSLIQETQRYSQRRPPPYFPASPSRRQPLDSRKAKDNRDPYRNQNVPRTVYESSPRTPSRKNVNDYDDYFQESDYEGERDHAESELPPSVRRKSQGGTTSFDSSSNKIKRKLTPGQEQQQQSQFPQPKNPRQQSRELPSRPPTYKRIANTFNSVPQPGAKTSLHAVLDFDDDFDDYGYDDDEEYDGGGGGSSSSSSGSSNGRAAAPPPSPDFRQKAPDVTPIEGPILIKNGSVPVVPLYSYPILNNGTLVQIPILWTALSLALGLEIHGEIIRGVPCVKRFHQLFCPTAGNTYPIERIERFIDDNKALMKRMYGEFQMSTDYGPPEREIFQARRRNVKRQANGEGPPPGSPDPTGGGKADSFFGRHRSSRQSFRSGQNDNGRVDACESKIEIVTPYWASNSAGKIRAIVNTQHFEQAIHQEVCSKVQTKRCVGDCGCEQKYKWHRLLAYDPDNDCKGIFMDWFLFPSCCVCRCAPIFGN